MKYILIVFFLFSSVFSFAQNDTKSFHGKNIPLDKLLEELEDAYTIKFSYNALLIKDIYVNLDIDNAGLRKILNRLEKQINIDFEDVDNRYYILKKKSRITICGYIKDQKTGDPIIGATISNGIGKIGTTSDEKGYFELKNVANSNELQISYLSYKSVKILADTIKYKSCSIYNLISENILLNEVIIKDYLAKGIRRLNDGAISLRPNNSEILSGLSEPDILHGIQLLPGIESPSENASGIFIRGGTPDQNLILWDDIKMYNSDHFFGMLSAFNPYIVKDVKVYRSGVNPEYGDRVSGIIDIKTNETMPIKTRAGFGLNMTHADVYLKQPFSKKVALITSARRSITDMISTPTFNAFSDKVFQNTSIDRNQEVFGQEFLNSKELFYFTDFTAKLLINPTTKDKISISSIFTKNKLDYSFKDALPTPLSSDRSNISNSGGSFVWDKTISKKTSLKTKLYYSKYDFRYAGENRFTDQNSITSKKNKILEFGGEIQTKWAINKSFLLINGYQFFNNEIEFLLGNEPVFDVATAFANNHSLYSQLRFKNQSSWYIDFGLRAGHTSVAKTLFFEPRFFLEYSLNKNFRVKISAERRVQTISQIIEFTTLNFGLENQIWALAESDRIPILKSNQFSGGFLFEKNDWKLDTDIYYKKTSGLTSYTRGFELTALDFSEGESITKGIDIFIKKRIKKYSTWLGYTYSTTDFIFDDLNDEKAFKGNNDITHSITWSHAYRWNQLQFSAGWKFRTGIPYTEALGVMQANGNSFIDYGDLNDSRLNNYHRLDLSFLYDVSLSKSKQLINAKIGVSALNVYGKRNILNRAYYLFEDSENNSTTLSEINKYSLGLTPNVFFRLNF